MNTERANGVRTLWWVSATPPIDLSDVETIPDSQLDSSANEDDDISSCIRSGSPDTLSKEQVPPSPPQQDRDEDARPGRVARPQLVAPSSIEQVVSEVKEAVHNTASTESSADVDYAAATEAYLRERLRFRVRKRTTADEARYRFLPKGPQTCPFHAGQLLLYETETNEQTQTQDVLANDSERGRWTDQDEAEWQKRKYPQMRSLKHMLLRHERLEGLTMDDTDTPLDVPDFELSFDLSDQRRVPVRSEQAFGLDCGTVVLSDLTSVPAVRQHKHPNETPSISNANEDSPQAEAELEEVSSGADADGGSAVNDGAERVQSLSPVSVMCEPAATQPTVEESPSLLSATQIISTDVLDAADTKRACVGETNASQQPQSIENRGITAVRRGDDVHEHVGATIVDPLPDASSEVAAVSTEVVVVDINGAQRQRASAADNCTRRQDHVADVEPSADCGSGSQRTSAASAAPKSRRNPGLGCTAADRPCKRRKRSSARFRTKHEGVLSGFDVLLTGFRSTTADKDDVAHLKRSISELGANYVEELHALRSKGRNNDTSRQVVVISATRSSTWKELFVLARGFPPVRASWLEGCRREGAIVPWEEHIACELYQPALVELSAPFRPTVPRSQRVLSGLSIHCVAKLSRRNEINAVVFAAGARPAATFDVGTVDILLVNEPFLHSKDTNKRGLTALKGKVDAALAADVLVLTDMWLKDTIMQRERADVHLEKYQLNIASLCHT